MTVYIYIYIYTHTHYNFVGEIIFYGHIFTEGVFITQLSSNVGISV